MQNNAEGVWQQLDAWNSVTYRPDWAILARQSLGSSFYLTLFRSAVVPQESTSIPHEQ
jgi:hypothetical protein